MKRQSIFYISLMETEIEQKCHHRLAWLSVTGGSHSSWQDGFSSLGFFLLNLYTCYHRFFTNSLKPCNLLFLTTLLNLYTPEPPRTTYLDKSYNFLAFQQAALLICLPCDLVFFKGSDFSWLSVYQTPPSSWWVFYLLLFSDFEIAPLLFIFP